MRTMRLSGRRRGPRTLGLVLSGGGARGAFQVGVYERLLEDARFAAGPAVLSGTSAGGINAALIAAGKSPREMLQFWKIDRKLLLERNRVTRLQGGPYREVILYEAVRPGRAAFFNAGSYLYFERGILGAMHDAGRRAAGAWLAAGPRVDHLDEPAAELALHVE